MARVLVVGAGNSAGEIAAELAAAGASVTIAVRSGARVVPRDVFGVPIQYLAIGMSRLPRNLQRSIAGAIASASALALLLSSGIAAAQAPAAPPAASPAAKGKPSKEAPANVLSKKEKAQGWKLLFDGKTLDGFRPFKGEGAPKNWGVEDGTLAWQSGGGDIVTKDEYESFELIYEWKISEGGNSRAFNRDF